MATIMINLVTKPFSICISVCTFFVKAGFIILQTWMELARATISFHVNMFWKTLLWMISLISLPSRVLNSLQRERLLEQYLHKVHYDLEILLWDREQLEDYLHIANKECRIMESMLAEAEDDNDRAVTKIQLLETEVQYLSAEILRLKEIQGKSIWSFNSHSDTAGPNIDNSGGITNIPHGIPVSKSGYEEGNTHILQGLRKQSGWDAKSKRNHEIVTAVEPSLLASAPLLPFTPGTVPKDFEFEVKQVLREKREIAFSQSIFSAMLSLLVGIVIWGSEDPCNCMPLVIALFIVVGISMKSVMQFFSKIKNIPGSDAIVLLSFNWFILGTVTYPILPWIARFFNPRT
ncbi:hypothetical protein ACFE04_017763 [Oxalis oulophora]